MRLRVAALFLSIVSLGFQATYSRGDTVIKTNGEKLTGLVVAETDTDITLQTNLQELLVRTKIARSTITSIHKDVLAENRYCRIPIHGEIGKDVKAEWLAKALQQATSQNANTLVLDFDTPGGEIAEMAKIIDLLGKQDKFRLIAHVHKAMSAGAMIAMACPTIVVDSHASIGAAVPWQIGPNGTPIEVEAKFIAAYRAICKSTAEAARHNPLIAQGMIDIDLELALLAKGGHLDVIEFSGPTRTMDSAICGNEFLNDPSGTERHFNFKRKGEILCLSSSEALCCGLAIGIADQPEDLQKIIKTKYWSPVGESVWAYLKARPAADKIAQEENRKNELESNQQSLLYRRLDAIDARILEVTNARTKAQATADALQKDYLAEIKKLPPTVNFDVQASEVKKKYNARFQESSNIVAIADLELATLQEQKSALETKIKAQ